MKSSIQVLMLEEDTDDRYLTEETLQELGFEVPLTFFTTSDALFAFLEQSYKPTLLLLDFNNSSETGLHILQRLKAHEHFKKFPVVILSDSTMPAYRQQCYAHGASSYIKKPGTMEETRQKIGLFFQYWLQVAEV